MRTRRPLAIAALALTATLTACTDAGPTVPDAGEQETPATEPVDDNTDVSDQG